MRHLVAAIGDWPKLVAQCFENTTPGGWAEFQDFDCTYYSEDSSLKDDHHIQKWITTFLQACHGFGRDPSPGSKLKGYIEDAGFENIQHWKYRLPIGPWAKDKHLVSVSTALL